jgi:hypothetical protein
MERCHDCKKILDDNNTSKCCEKRMHVCDSERRRFFSELDQFLRENPSVIQYEKKEDIKSEIERIRKYLDSLCIDFNTDDN